MTAPSTNQPTELHWWPHSLQSSDGTGPYMQPEFEPKNPVMRWFEARLPLFSFTYKTAVSYPTPRNLNYWWTFGAILAFMLVVQIVTGVVLAMHYTPDVDAGLQLGRAHHARRELRLAAALPARQRRLDVLPRRLHPHVPRHVLRLLQGAARSAVDDRRDDLPADDGHGLHGLRAALGPDVLLGRRRSSPTCSRPSRWSANRRRPGCGAATRSTIRRSTASSRCTTCCPSSSPPSSCCTSGRCMSSGNNNPTGVEVKSAQGHGSVHALLHDEGRLRDGRVPASSMRLDRVLHPELSRPRRQLHAGQSAGDAGATSCRNGTTCRSTRSCARSRTSSLASSRCSRRS